MKPTAIISNQPFNVQAARLGLMLSLWLCNASMVFLFNNMLFMGLLLSLLGRFLLLMFNPHTLPITAVRIEGDLIKTDPQVLIVTRSQVARGGFFSINLTAARLAVLAWMKDVRVLWPDTLVIPARQAVARWQDKLVRYNNGIAVRTAKAE